MVVQLSLLLASLSCPSVERLSRLGYLITLGGHHCVMDGRSTICLNPEKKHGHQNGHYVRSYKLAEAEFSPTILYTNYHHVPSPSGFHFIYCNPDPEISSKEVREKPQSSLFSGLKRFTTIGHRFGTLNLRVELRFI